MPMKKKAISTRQLIEPTKGDKRYGRRNAKGESTRSSMSASRRPEKRRCQKEGAERRGRPG